MQYLIIINGPPGSGKSYLGNLLSKNLILPYISKDDIKELLFDNLNWGSRKISKVLGIVSFEILVYFIKNLIHSAHSCIIEAAFHPSFDTKTFIEIEHQFNVEFIQIFCTADASILFQRCKNRILSGERHPGHVDKVENVQEFETMVNSNKYGKLEIGGEYIEINTNDFSGLIYNNLIDHVNSLLNPNE